MVWWWRRRRRWWTGYKRPFYKKRKRYRRKRRWRRRKPRRTYRRRRRGRTKVKRKRKTINLKQWQPDTIRKCKIKGISLHVLGAEGKQFACYTDNRFSWTPPQTPGGGGFGVEKYTLEYLYKEYLRGNNIWTESNVYLDLIRYMGCQITFFRHPYVDFIVQYRRMYPMSIDKYSYSESHPYHLLKQRHKKIIPSFRHKPYGKRYVKVKIGPPKQFVNKWFFQEAFAETGLVQLTSAACDLDFSYMGCCNQNQLITFYALNLQFYTKAGWGNATAPGTLSKWYNPTGNMATGTWTGKDIQGNNIQVNINNDTGPNSYMQSINYDGGWFTPKLLQMVTVTNPQLVAPVKVARYNLNRDDGVNNAIWLVSALNYSYESPRTDKTLIIDNLPLWQLMYGFMDYVQKVKQDTTFLKSYYMVIQSTAIEPHTGLDKYHIPIDMDFIKGKGPYGEYVTSAQKQKWFVTLEHQLSTINSFVEAGPFIPKLGNQRNSTWELKSTYKFFFKFGGAELPEKETADPAKQGTTDVPDKLKSTIQISDPTQQKAAEMLHAWDFRRGIITKTACKRILKDRSTCSSLFTDAEEPTAKKAKIYGNAVLPQVQENKEMQTCLLSLCESSSCQEEEEETPNLYQLIQQQKHKQHSIKNKLLKLITELKCKQNLLQLQTGMLE